MVHVMVNSVNRYRGSDIPANGLSGSFFVKEEYAVQLERQLDAQRLRADTAEADADQFRESSAQLATDLIAAEQRIAELTGLLREILLRRRFTEDMHERIPAVIAGGSDPSTVSMRAKLTKCDALLREIAGSSSENIKVFGARINAALNPNPEAESHE